MTDHSEYRPAIPDAHWATIGEFVRNAVTDSIAGTPYSMTELMSTVTRHVHWCWQAAGFELDREVIFSRRVIAHAVGQSTRGLTPASQANLRAQLLRVAEQLLDDDGLLHLPALPSSSPSKPYTSSELTVLRSWSRGQTTPRGRQSAAALVSLGVGAGLAARELCAVTAADVCEDDEGVLVSVTSGRCRTVPLLRSWEEMLLETVSSAKPGVPLFRPGHGTFYPNIVTNFVARSAGIELKPQSPRMRATWVVTMLAAGVAPRELMRAAGVSSLEAFTRFMPFVPPGDEGLARFTLRHAEFQDFG
jgi:hypothetical protein